MKSKHLFTVLTAVGMLFVGSGCNARDLLGNTGFTQEFGEFAKVIAKQVADQGVLERLSSEIEGHMQDPGVETSFTIKFASAVRLIGTNGEIEIGAQHTGTILPPGMREELINQLSGPISDQQRQAILDLLGWNRRQVTGGTGAGGDGDSG